MLMVIYGNYHALSLVATLRLVIWRHILRRTQHPTPPLERGEDAVGSKYTAPYTSHFLPLSLQWLFPISFNFFKTINITIRFSFYNTEKHQNTIYNLLFCLKTYSSLSSASSDTLLLRVADFIGDVMQTTLTYLQEKWSRTFATKT